MSEYNTIPNEQNIDDIVEDFEYSQEYNPASNTQPLTFEDIIDKTVGLDEYDNPKAGFGLEVGVFDSTTNNARVVSSLTYYNPSINIIRTGEVMIVDFIYNSRTDSDLRAFWALLNKYGKDFETSLRQQSTTLPILRLQIVPNYYSGRYSIACVAPMYWVLQPEIPTGEINTIRIVFGVDNVAFLETAGYDEKTIFAEIQREEMQREFIEQATETRKEEEEEYRNQRNEMLEELRRKGEL